jgi:hypothetical protein
MGKFDAAEQTLREVSSDLGWVAEQIRSFCAAKDTRVHVLATVSRPREMVRFKIETWPCSVAAMASSRWSCTVVLVIAFIWVAPVAAA